MPEVALASRNVRPHKSILQMGKIRAIFISGHFGEKMLMTHTWNGDTGQWATARVQVIEQHTKCVRVKFNYAEFRLSQFGAIDLLCVRTH